jgi:hypothetical protein
MEALVQPADDGGDHHEQHGDLHDECRRLAALQFHVVLWAT